MANPPGLDIKSWLEEFKAFGFDSDCSGTPQAWIKNERKVMGAPQYISCGVWCFDVEYIHTDFIHPANSFTAYQKVVLQGGNGSWYVAFIKTIGVPASYYGGYGPPTSSTTTFSLNSAAAESLLDGTACPNGFPHDSSGDIEGSPINFFPDGEFEVISGDSPNNGTADCCGFNQTFTTCGFIHDSPGSTTYIHIDIEISVTGNNCCNDPLLGCIKHGPACTGNCNTSSTHSTGGVSSAH